MQYLKASYQLLCKIALIIITVIATYTSALAESGSSINRLFISPAFRAQIDLYRNNPDLYKPPEVVTKEDKKTVEQATAPTSIKINGVITRPDGTKIAWIDGQQQAQAISKQTGATSNSILVKLDDKTAVQLKAGQVYQSHDNSVREAFEIKSETAETNNAGQDSSSSSKNSENADQSVEEPHEITKTLIDIVNNKKTSTRVFEGFEP